MSFQLLKALENGLFEFEDLRLFLGFEYLLIRLFTVESPIETNHAISPHMHQFLVYYRDSHINKLVKNLNSLQTRTDRSPRLLGVGSSASDMFLPRVGTCFRYVFR